MSMETPSRLSVVAWSRRAQMIDVGGDLDPDVRPAEANAVFGRCGLEIEADGTAGVQADACAAHAALESSPIRHET